MRAALGRLKRRSEFLRVAASKRKWAAPGLVLQVGPSPQPSSPPSGGAAIPGGLPRVGFTCSKKVGNAVARNRARRRLRAIAQQVLAVEGEPGHDYVLIGRQETLNRPFALLLRDLEIALKRLSARRVGAAPESQMSRREET